MARITKNKILGSLKDITIYEVDGKIIVARKGGFNKKQYADYESLNGHRQRSKEFKFCSHVSKLIRHSLNEYRYIFKTKISADLTGQIQLVCKNDLEGLMGQRKVDLKANGKVIEEYSLSTKVFNTMSQVPFAVVISEERRIITLNMPEFMPLIKMCSPQGSNSFKIILTATLVNSFEFNSEKKEYLPELGKGFSFSKAIESVHYNNTVMVQASNLEIDFDFVPETSHGLVVCIGIEFFDSFSTRVNTNKDWSVMKIAKVG